MKNFFKTSIYILAFAFAGILFQISCSNSDDTTPDTTISKMLFSKGNGMNQTIWMCDLDGTNQVQVPIALPPLTTFYTFYSSGEHTPLKFSPDGQKILFVTSLGNQSQICSCNLDGSNVQPLITTNGGLFIGDVQ